MLQQLAEDQTAVRYPPMPRWFYPVQAGLLAGLCLAQLLPSPAAAVASVLTVVPMVLLGLRYWLDRAGVSGVSVSVRDMLPFLAGTSGTILLAMILSETTGAWWVWIVAAIVVAGVVLRTGSTYRREYGDAT